MKTSFLYTLTIALLSVFAGGCLTILFIIVPFWYTLSPTGLMDWFAAFGPRVGITMLPMEIIPLVLSVGCWFRSKKEGANPKEWMVVSISNLLMLLSFFVYFLPVNFSFVSHKLNASEVGPELVRWEIMHIGRTILSILSAGLAIKITAAYLYHTKQQTL